MRVLVLANFGMGLHNFRKELLEKLVEQDVEVFLSFPRDEYVPKLEKIGCNFLDTKIDRRGTNPFKDIKLFIQYIKRIKKIKPDVVLTYTIKPNVYGGLVCRMLNVPYISNITGLGSSIENEGLIQKITLNLYKHSLKETSCVFFQNEVNQNFFQNNNIVNGKTRLIPGSGVNLNEHRFEQYPISDERIDFLFIGRLMKAKGILELLDAAKKVKGMHPHVHFNLVGGSEENFNEKLNELEKQQIIKYHGQQENVHSFIKDSHATILPSYHEGLANVLLESASTGRPVLASRIPGCIETFEEDKTGIGFEAKNTESLYEAIMKFIELPYKEKKEMGLAARMKMEREFDRKIVINAYIEEINLLNKENENETLRKIN